jgi:two-component system CheB/CheR fusion protein
LTIGLLVGAVSLTQVNGVHNATLYVYVIFIILSNIIFVRRTVVLAVMMVSILTVLIVAVLQERGDIPLREMPVPIVNRAFVAIIIFSITGIVSSYASSALRRNLARVRQNEERYRLLFEYASIMAMVYDSQGKIILANDAAVKWIDKTREEVEGRFIDELASPENAAALKKMNQQALASGEVLEFERTTTDKFGAPVSYLRHVIPLPAIDGPQVLGLSTDITAQKRNLERQQELQAAQEKVAFYTDFFGTISHDLKTPLSVMQTSLYLLQRAENEERRHEKIDQLHHQVNLLEAYIQDMLLVSQLEHVPVLERELVDLPVLMADIVQALQPKIEDKRIDCTIQHQDENLKIQVDRDQIRRALTNLVENAVNYTAVGGRVSVSTSQKKSVVSIEVSDTGIGIQAGDVPHIFDAFYRASEAKSTLSTGSGLGLAIVKRIAELHGGSIVVESKPQQGSCFTLTLPA